MTTISEIPIEEYFVVARDEDGLCVTNVPPVFQRHSRAGFEFGFGGSGPADLALNLTVEACLQLGIIHAPRTGDSVPAVVEGVYQSVKKRFIESAPDQGARVPMEDVRKYVADLIDEFMPN